MEIKLEKVYEKEERISCMYHFPFWGAGEASYFEWAEVHVVFREAPSEPVRKEIAAAVPPPLQDSVIFQQHFLSVSSGQYAHRVIAEAYDADEGDEPYVPSDEEDGDMAGRWFFSAASQVRRFNLATEEWLRRCHSLCPIVVAYRRQDYESGGTLLSDWHDWSVSQCARFLPFIQALDPEHYVVKRLLDECECDTLSEE